ncbi:hypothetical protein BGZ75_005787, partial [Mortierella antarctica]
AVPASVDSDLFLHTTIARVLRKVGKDEINDVRWGLKLSELQCLVLGMVSRSDYAINIHNMGLKRNCKVIQLLVFPNDVVEYGLWLRNRQLAKRRLTALDQQRVPSQRCRREKRKAMRRATCTACNRTQRKRGAHTIARIGMAQLLQEPRLVSLLRAAQPATVTAGVAQA